MQRSRIATKTTALSLRSQHHYLWLTRFSRDWNLESDPFQERFFISSGLIRRHEEMSYGASRRKQDINALQQQKRALWYVGEKKTLGDLRQHSTVPNLVRGYRHIKIASLKHPSKLAPENPNYVLVFRVLAKRIFPKGLSEPNEVSILLTVLTRQPLISQQRSSGVETT